MGIKLKLEFDCDNAAFEGENFLSEIARILKGASNNIHLYLAYDNPPVKKFDIPLVDINGNRVGRVKTVRTNKARSKK